MSYWRGRGRGRLLQASHHRLHKKKTGGIVLLQLKRNGFNGRFDFFHFSLKNSHRCCSEKGCYYWESKCTCRVHGGSNNCPEVCIEANKRKEKHLHHVPRDQAERIDVS